MTASAIPIPLQRIAAPKIILFGDSITELSSDQSLSFALTPALQHEYFRKLQVVARGYGGYTTEHARHLLEPILDYEAGGGSTEIKLLTIFFGTNDMKLVDYQRVPLDRYMTNLRDMVDLAQKRNIPTILISPGPIDEYSANGMDDDGLSMLRARAYAEAGREVAAEKNVPFIDLWQGLLCAQGWVPGQQIIGKMGEATDRNLRDLLTDGVHFSGKAYRIWYDLLLSTLREEFPDLRTENLPTVLPHIFDVDHKNLPESLWQVVEVKR
jgi:lysophospholipase L1-like esterase